MVKTIYVTYAKADLEQVASNITQLNDDDKTQLIGLLEVFEGLFYGTVRKWDTEVVVFASLFTLEWLRYKWYQYITCLRIICGTCIFLSYHII